MMMVIAEPFSHREGAPITAIEVRCLHWRRVFLAPAGRSARGGQRTEATTAEANAALTLMRDRIAVQRGK
jgi:hypothetical protein